MSRMIVRNPTPGEVERAAEIASVAFPDLPLAHWQRSFETTARAFGERFILVVELDGLLVSSMICTPGPIYIGEGTVSHSAVGAVGTLPDYRKCGCAGAMMTESVKLLRAERVCTSSLWPFSYKYYRKFGWELAAETRSYSAASEALAKLGDAGRTRFATPGDLESIMLAYDEYARTYNCLTQRTADWWRDVAWCDVWLRSAFEPGERGCIVHTADGRLDGYAIYKVVKPGDDLPLKIEVGEMVFEEPSDRFDLLAGLAQISPVGSVIFGAPADDMLIHELADPRSIACAMRPSHMFRVIDPPGAMLSLRSEAHATGRLSLSVSDPVFAPGFEFGMEINGGRIDLCDFDPDSALEMDVQTLAKLYSGCLSPIQAWCIGKLRVRSEMIVNLAFAGQVFSSLTPYRSWHEPG